jgi:S-adenosylmethionine-diacylglycerol 3-amino-3-carboxypropyl transferase
MSEISYSPTFQAQLGSAVHQNAALSRTGLLERLFSRLFEGLVYPQIWEDPVVDMAALKIGAEDDLVCIASGGCNVMSYLTASPRSITAVDLSPAHVALLKLKLAAARGLPEHSKFFEFFGNADFRGNARLYDAAIAPALDAETRAFWDARGLRGRRIAMFERGFYRHGLLGRFIATVHVVARLAGVDFRPLLTAQSVAEQRHFFETRIAPLFENRLVRFLARRRAALFGLGIPPAQYDKLAADAGGDVIPVLRERTRKLMCDFPIRENYFAWQAFNRAYEDNASASVPPYLEARHYEAVRGAADRVRVLNRPLTDLLAAEPARSKSCYVFLDAQDWMTDAQLDALWTEVTRTAAPGARVIFRTGGADDILPGRLSPAILGQWCYDAGASARGHAADRSAIYGGFHLYRLRG